MRRTWYFLAAALALVTMAVTGCAGRTPADGTTVYVVAGTDVWGNIAAQIGGSAVHVTSLIDNPAVDPHEYQTTVRDAAEVNRADLVIRNGLGYDDFLARLVESGHRRGLTIVVVADTVGAASDANPHLWYSTADVDAAARAVEAALAARRPNQAATFAANLTRFLAGENQVAAVADRIKTTYRGELVAYTEPVPAYLVQAAGLRLGTPTGFSLAIEDGRDPSPADSTAFEQALTGHRVRVLLYNSQVTDAETIRLLSLARQGGVPVVPVSETLPPGQQFQTWQTNQALALLHALATP